MLCCNEHFLNWAQYFIEWPHYMDVYIPHTSRKVIGQLRVSSHQLETKTGQVLCIPIAKSSWKLCERGTEHEDLFCVGSELKAHKKEICHSQTQIRQVLIGIHSRREALLRAGSSQIVHQLWLTQHFVSWFPFSRISTFPLNRAAPRIIPQKAEANRALRQPCMSGVLDTMSFVSPDCHRWHSNGFRLYS